MDLVQWLWFFWDPLQLKHQMILIRNIVHISTGGKGGEVVKNVKSCKHQTRQAKRMLILIYFLFIYLLF